MAEIERWLMFTHWGSYLKGDYIEVGLDVTEILMKYLEACQLEGRKNTVLENLDPFDSIRKEVLSDRERYRFYEVTFFNPSGYGRDLCKSFGCIRLRICFLKSMMDSRFIKRRIKKSMHNEPRHCWIFLRMWPGIQPLRSCG